MWLSTAWEAVISGNGVSSGFGDDWLKFAGIKIFYDGGMTLKTALMRDAYPDSHVASQPSPTARWPELNVDPALPATDPSRAGLALFVKQCLPCHAVNGAGASALDPDLNQPMNPTQYLTREGLRALIRDPKSVRNWPGLQMPGFPADQMTDREIDLVIIYLTHMATRRGTP